MNNEIDNLINAFRLIVDKCLVNLDEDSLTKIKDETRILIEQGVFWIKENNVERYTYELKKFLTWLVDYVEIKENEFWGESKTNE